MNRFFIILSLLFLPLSAGARVEIDTTKSNIAAYLNELGYFQKANRDMGDPRFMFRDGKTNMEFGVGGAVRAAAFYTCFGQVNNLSFAPSLVTIPNDYSPSFGTKISASELFLKGRASLWRRPLIAFLKIGGDDDNRISIKQAYISFAGFSIGRIPSFFTDLETGVMTTGIGDNSLISKDHPLFGYEYRFRNGIQLAAAIEASELNLDHYSGYFTWRVDHSGYTDPFCRVASDYQSLPDFSFHLKYRWDCGHVQLGGLFRKLNYWSRLRDFKYEADGVTKSAFGWGAMLSGHFELCDKRLYLSYELLGGSGIGTYMTDFSKVSLNMGYVLDSDAVKYASMAPASVIGTQLAMQYKWTPKLSSSFIYAWRHSFSDEGLAIWHDYRTNSIGELSNTNFALANLVWNLTDYARISFEAMFAQKNLRGYDGSKPNGTSLRAAVEFAYYF